MKFNDKFTYVVISKERFDTMLGMEEGFTKSRPLFDRWEEKMICDSEEPAPRPDFYAAFRYNPDTTQMESDDKLRFVNATSDLESGKEYDVIIFPKTCSPSICFVKPQEDPKQ